MARPNADHFIADDHEYLRYDLDCYEQLLREAIEDQIAYDEMVMASRMTDDDAEAWAFTLGVEV